MMPISKIRVPADPTGLVPAGRYFDVLAERLRETNARDAARRKILDTEDRDLEAAYMGARHDRLAQCRLRLAPTSRL